MDIDAGAHILQGSRRDLQRNTITGLGQPLRTKHEREGEELHRHLAAGSIPLDARPEEYESTLTKKRPAAVRRSLLADGCELRASPRSYPLLPALPLPAWARARCRRSAPGPDRAALSARADGRASSCARFPAALSAWRRGHE